MLTETVGVIMAIVGVGSVLATAVTVIVAASLMSKRNTEEIKELHEGFKTVILLAAQMENLNKNVERIATNIDIMRNGLDAMDRRMTVVEIELKGISNGNQQQGQGSTRGT